MSSDVDAGVTILMSLDTWNKLQSEELELMGAMGAGLMKVEGNMQLMMTTARPVMKAINEAFKKLRGES